jgi:hypothetical protein
MLSTIMKKGLPLRAIIEKYQTIGDNERIQKASRERKRERNESMLNVGIRIHQLLDFNNGLEKEMKCLKNCNVMSSQIVNEV